jgi:hypothetical protein
MGIKKSPINDSDELDILCLLSDISICPYRYRLVIHFGSEAKMQCPYRKMLKRKYDEWQAAREHKKFAEEYPNDV